MQVPTVKIAVGNGFAVINACDYDASVHSLYGQEKKPAKVVSEQPAEPPPAAAKPARRPRKRSN